MHHVDPLYELVRHLFWCWHHCRPVHGPVIPVNPPSFPGGNTHPYS